MKKQTILITGASRGLGLAIARRLAKDGYQVIATARKITPDLEQLIGQSEKDRVHFYKLDLNNVECLAKSISNITSQHGPLWGLVNNAAVGHDGILPTQHDSQIEELIRVNVHAPIVLAKYASRSMLVGGGGRIINVSSIIAMTGYKGLAVYGATKAAMSGFTRSLSRDLGGAGITVNTLAPGYMQTEMTNGLNESQLASVKRRSPLGKLASTDDVAGSVAFLLGPDAESITGATLTIDAGSTA